MERIELEKIALSIFTEGRTIIESSLEPREYYIRTSLWQINYNQIEKLKEKGITPLSISTEGGTITLEVKA